jgi:hypothetical protein
VVSQFEVIREYTNLSIREVQMVQFFVSEALGAFPDRKTTYCSHLSDEVTKDKGLQLFLYEG